MDDGCGAGDVTQMLTGSKIRQQRGREVSRGATVRMVWSGPEVLWDPRQNNFLFYCLFFFALCSTIYLKIYTSNADEQKKKNELQMTIFFLLYILYTSRNIIRLFAINMDF